MESIKMALTKLLATAMDTQTQRTDLWTQGGEGEGETNGEGSLETYTTICKIDSQWEFAV